MKVEETDLDGVLLITPPTIFKDFRGEYVETYNKELYFEKVLILILFKMIFLYLKKMFKRNSW